MKKLIFCLIALSVQLTMAATLPTTWSDFSTRSHRGATPGNLGRAMPLIREGDVVFVRVRHALYRRISETSGSWESHVGIILRGSEGGWIVAESTIPVSKFTSLERFVGRSENGRFLIRRLRSGISGEELQRLCAATERRMGKLYDTGFEYDSSRQFCSKFVHDCFLEATGQAVGRIETFRELFSENPQAPVFFWRTWFFGRIPWDRRCVTTASQIQAPNMVTVFDSEDPSRDETIRKQGRPASPGLAMSASVRR